MNQVRFRQTSPDSKPPYSLAGGTGWLFYPSFDEDHLLIHPGDTVTVGCGVDFLSSEKYVLTLYTCPGCKSPLIIHPSFIVGGEAVTGRFTNASHQVCVIAKEQFDFTSKRGHGIFRSAVVIPYNQPVACGIPTLCGIESFPDRVTESGAEGMCSL